MPGWGGKRALLLAAARALKSRNTGQGNLQAAVSGVGAAQAQRAAGGEGPGPGTSTSTSTPHQPQTKNLWALAGRRGGGGARPGRAWRRVRTARRPARRLAVRREVLADVPARTVRHEALFVDVTDTRRFCDAADSELEVVGYHAAIEPPAPNPSRTHPAEVDRILLLLPPPPTSLPLSTARLLHGFLG